MQILPIFHMFKQELGLLDYKSAVSLSDLISESYKSAWKHSKLQLH